MSDKPVWLEDLVVESVSLRPIVLRVDGDPDGAMVGLTSGAHPMPRPRANAEANLPAWAALFAAAPALVRALLLVEWCRPEGWPCAICTACNGIVDDGLWHHNACALDAALTLAGFPDQTSRDAARKLMAEAK